MSTLTRTPRKPLALDAVMPLAQSLAIKEAHRPEDIDDLVQVGLFAYHRATFKKHVRPDKPHAFARTVVQRAMRGYYWQQREWQGRGEPNKNCRMDDAGAIEATMTTFYSGLGGRETLQDVPRTLDGRGRPVVCAGLDGKLVGGEQAELLEFDDYFNALERKCGTVARLMVENLLMPSGECCARILEEVRAKQDAQATCSKRTKAHQPRGVKKEIRISHRLVRDALQISPTEWAQHMERIREFTREWIGQ